ncbi:hypothetical protein B0H14DRAFT_2618221 [Mycena olivaceomarginata]|nr:hypothetical protein B0H14DRAFT_2618221 [Mycena olivaceomarginata]
MLLEFHGYIHMPLTAYIDSRDVLATEPPPYAHVHRVPDQDLQFEKAEVYLYGGYASLASDPPLNRQQNTLPPNFLLLRNLEPPAQNCPPPNVSDTRCRKARPYVVYNVEELIDGLAGVGYFNVLTSLVAPQIYDETLDSHVFFNTSIATSVVTTFVLTVLSGLVVISDFFQSFSSFMQWLASGGSQRLLRMSWEASRPAHTTRLKSSAVYFAGGLVFVILGFRVAWYTQQIGAALASTSKYITDPFEKQLHDGAQSDTEE